VNSPSGVSVPSEGVNSPVKGCEFAIRGCEFAVRGCEFAIKGCEFAIRGCVSMNCRVEPRIGLLDTSIQATLTKRSDCSTSFLVVH
jgi:hypothetical protein